MIVRQVVSGLMLGAIYMTVAVAFTLTIGVLNFLNFTIPTLFMLTGMVAWALLSRGIPHLRRRIGLAGGAADRRRGRGRGLACWWSASPSAT